MSIAELTLYLQIPGCTSLKEKRGHIKTLLSRLHREFNISVAETDLLDHWQETIITCAIASNDPNFNTLALQRVVAFINVNFSDFFLVDDQIRLL
jgi:uncharacterized protein